MLIPTGFNLSFGVSQSICIRASYVEVHAKRWRADLAICRRRFLAV